MAKGWIGVDLDGCIAEYHGWRGPEEIGPPVPLMLTRVKKWIKEGKDVRIFTARIAHPDGAVACKAMLAIHRWTKEHVGKALPVTNIKDLDMIECWDDRCVQVVKNTGERVDGIPE